MNFIAANFQQPFELLLSLTLDAFAVAGEQTAAEEVFGFGCKFELRTLGCTEPGKSIVRLAWVSLQIDSEKLGGRFERVKLTRDWADEKAQHGKEEARDTSNISEKSHSVPHSTLSDVYFGIQSNINLDIWPDKVWQRVSLKLGRFYLFAHVQV